MIGDLAREIALFSLFVIGGGFGIFEIVMKMRRNPEGGLLWLALIFVIDGSATLLAYLFLDAALKDELWGNSVGIYIAALIWSPFLLRTQFEFLVPGGPKARDFFRILPAARSFLADRVYIGSAIHTSMWIGKEVTPAVVAKGEAWLENHAISFFSNLAGITENERVDLLNKTRVTARDSGSESAERIRAMAQLLIDNRGRSILRTLVKEVGSNT